MSTAAVLPFVPRTSPDHSSTLAKVCELRMAIWLTPFITDGDTRTQLLHLADDIAADLTAPPTAAGGAR